MHSSRPVSFVRHSSYGFVLLCAILIVQATGQPLGKSMQSLRLLCGSWKMSSNNGDIWEQWAQYKQQLKGVSFSVKGKDSTQLEDVLVTMRNGQLYYAARTSGEAESKRVYFRLVKQQALKYEFENLQHDFPQRIVYHFIGTDSLHAWIEGPMDGKTHRQHFYYKRMK